MRNSLPVYCQGRMHPGRRLSMLVLATAEVVRVMGVWVRRADAGLAEGAVRNAAARVADRDARDLDEARTLRDVGRLRPMRPAEPPARPGVGSDLDPREGPTRR